MLYDYISTQLPFLSFPLIRFPCEQKKFILSCKLSPNILGSIAFQKIFNPLLFLFSLIKKLEAIGSLLKISDMCFLDSVLGKHGNISDKSNSSENEYLEKMLPFLLLGEHYWIRSNHSSTKSYFLLQLTLCSAYAIIIP